MSNDNYEKYILEARQRLVDYLADRQIFSLPEVEEYENTELADKSFYDMCDIADEIFGMTSIDAEVEKAYVRIAQLEEFIFDIEMHIDDLDNKISAGDYAADDPGIKLQIRELKLKLEQTNLELQAAKEKAENAECKFDAYSYLDVSFVNDGPTQTLFSMD